MVGLTNRLRMIMTSVRCTVNICAPGIDPAITNLDRDSTLSRGATRSQRVGSNPSGGFISNEKALADARLFHLVRRGGLEPPMPIKAADLQSAGIAAIRPTHT